MTAETTSFRPTSATYSSGKLLWLPALLFGFLFLLPHVVRVSMLGAGMHYSPFSSRIGSAMNWDETFLYGPEANYTLTHGWAPAYTDTWEKHTTPYPYSILPSYLEAATGALTGGIDHAHIVLQFVFPALTLLLVMYLLRRCGASTALAACLGTFMLLMAFSPRTLMLDDLAFVRHAHGARVFDTLQGARTPNPNLTFPLLLAAMASLAAAIRQRRAQSNAGLGWAALAGVLGGLLFYSYIYYAIVWAAALALLSALAVVWPRWMPRLVWLPLVISGALAVPFVLWKHAAEHAGVYLPRSSRLGLEHGHALHAESIKLTAEWGIFAVLCGAAWLWLRGRARQGERERWAFADAFFPVLLAAIAGGLGGLNMQLVTGFNVQAQLHFPHMALQPLCLLALAAVVALALRDSRALRLAAGTGFALLFAAAAIAQFESARDSAPFFAIGPAEQALFHFLNAQTPQGSVVVTDDLPLSVVLPVRTHNSVLYSQGTRSNADDDELMERFLLASHLLGASPEQVSGELEERYSLSGVKADVTHTFYMYEASSWETNVDGYHVKADRLPEAMAWYARMDPAQELEKFRVDYLWVQPGRTPALPAGWTAKPVFASADGRLLQLAHAG